ncbi:MAG: DnaB-like helicase C-terminal domain-containing protein [Syntrophomonadaceae bacterium]|nr:DnaB-like helicase C-terminal domain-containing protein [Syntrophomonadaceae bacterium]
MDKEQAQKFINDQLEFYIKGKGLDPSKDFNCLNPAHSDENYRMSIDRSMGQPFHAKCKVCNAFYNTFDLIEIDYRLNDSEEIFNKACELFNLIPDQDGSTGTHHNLKPASAHMFKKSNWPSRLSLKNLLSENALNSDAQEDNKVGAALKKYITQAQGQIHQTDYFQERGLSYSTIENFKLGYDPDFKTKEGAECVSWQAVIIPSGPYSYTAINTDLSAEKQNRIRRNGPSTIFNQIALQNDKPVFIVAEEMAALSLFEAGIEAVAIGNPGNIHLLTDIFRHTPPTGGVVICLEDDSEDNLLTLEISSLLHANDIPYIATNIFGNYKDLSEALSVSRDQFIRTVQATQDAIIKQLQAKQLAEREAYLLTNSTHHLQGFLSMKDNVNTACIPTGFAKLDQLLDGGLYEGLYVLAGSFSSGKTSWVLQVADQIAQAGNDILILSLETARTELVARSISRLTFLSNSDKNLAISTRGITTAKKYGQHRQAQLDSIRAGMEDYGQYADKIYIIEGTEYTNADEVSNILSRHIRITGNRPVIIVDYLQALASPKSEAYPNSLPRTLTKLKRISRDYRTPVLAVSTIDLDHNQRPIVIETFKESDFIVNSSDVLIGLQVKGAGSTDFDFYQVMNQNPRKSELKVLKNRNGALGGILPYSYYPAFNCFVEE